MENYGKEQIRKNMLNIRSKMTQEEVDTLSQEIISTLTKLPIFKSSSNLMLYLSFGNEVDTFNLIELCKELGKKIIVPFCINQGKVIVPTEIKNVKNDLVKSSFGYLEPKKEIVKPVSIDEIDLIILPGIAFDRSCYRIGFGAGYYDRFLAKVNFKIPTIGLAYDKQIIELIPIENHDVPVDYVITDKKIITR